MIVRKHLGGNKNLSDPLHLLKFTYTNVNGGILGSQKEFTVIKEGVYHNQRRFRVTSLAFYLNVKPNEMGILLGQFILDCNRLKKCLLHRLTRILSLTNFSENAFPT